MLLAIHLTIHWNVTLSLTFSHLRFFNNFLSLSLFVSFSSLSLSLFLCISLVSVYLSFFISLSLCLSLSVSLSLSLCLSHYMYLYLPDSRSFLLYIFTSLFFSKLLEFYCKLRIILSFFD